MPVDIEVANWTVLLVDDEPDNIAIARMILSYHGAQVHTATDGMEGLILLARVRPTFILLDLSMPRVDGWEMLRQIREIPELATLPVIALTAHALSGDRQRALAAGFDGYITKPFRMATLLSDIKACLRQIGRTRQEAVLP